MEQAGIRLYGYRWIILIVFALAQAGIQVHWSTFLPITGEAAKFYGVTPLAIGLLSMMFMLIYVLISLPSSWAISNFGVHKAVGFAVTLMGVFGLVRGLFGDKYTIVLISTVMLSVTQPFIINSITTMSARWFPADERATATGLAMLAQLSGIMGGMAVTPVLVTAIGIKSTLIAYGIFSACVFFLFILFYREHPPTPHSSKEFEEETPLIRQGLKIIFRDRNAILLMIIFCVGITAFNGVSTWIEQILSPRGFTSIQAGMIGGIMLLGGIIGSIVIPLLSDKTKKRKPYLLLGVGVIIPGLLGLTYLESFLLLLLTGGVLGVFQLGLAPIIMESTADVCRPATEATSQGVLWMFGQGLSVAGIFLMDAFRTESGAMTPFMLVFMFLMILNLIYVMMLNESRLMYTKG